MIIQELILSEETEDGNTKYYSYEGECSTICNAIDWNDCVEIKNEQVVKVEVSWCVEDVRYKLNVSHMTDQEIFDELENMTKDLQEAVLSCSSDLIDSHFKIKGRNK